MSQNLMLFWQLASVFKHFVAINIIAVFYPMIASP